jgi:putative transposase
MAPPKPYTPRAQRLDRVLYAEANRITFITICASPGLAPFVRPELNRTILNILSSEQVRLACTVFTYCLMPNHLHFLVKPNEDGRSILDFTDRYKGKSTNASWACGWRGKLWQRGYYDHIVRTDEALVEIAQYISNNPVRKGLVATAEAWPWSGHLNPLPG